MKHIDHHMGGHSHKGGGHAQADHLREVARRVFRARPGFSKTVEKEPQEGKHAHDAGLRENKEVLVVDHVQIDVPKLRAMGIVVHHRHERIGPDAENWTPRNHVPRDLDEIYPIQGGGRALLAHEARLDLREEKESHHGHDKNSRERAMGNRALPQFRPCARKTGRIRRPGSRRACALGAGETGRRRSVLTSTTGALTRVD